MIRAQTPRNINSNPMQVPFMQRREVNTFTNVAVSAGTSPIAQTRPSMNINMMIDSFITNSNN